MNINRVKLQQDRELIMFWFYFPLFVVLLCDINFTHSILSTPACNVLFNICLTENNLPAITLRKKRLLTISKINITQ